MMKISKSLEKKAKREIVVLSKRIWDGERTLNEAMEKGEMDCNIMKSILLTGPKK
jgi:hypothetical protein